MDINKIHSETSVFNGINGSNGINGNDLELKTNKDILMFYQTTLRNIALTTAVSFAALGYSRFYRDKSLFYSSGLVLVSLLLIVCSIIINYNLFNIINKHSKKNKKLSSANNFLIINKIFVIIHILLIVCAAYTFFRLLTGTEFNKK